jgi:hypothetical protein
MNDEITGSRYLAFTVGALGIVFLLYPATVAGIGPASNGGILGLGFLVIASSLSWWAFSHNRVDPWMRRIVQLPVTAVVTFLAMRDAFCQSIAGWWWGF